MKKAGDSFTLQERIERMQSKAVVDAVSQHLRSRGAVLVNAAKEISSIDAVLLHEGGKELLVTSVPADPQDLVASLAENISGVMKSYRGNQTSYGGWVAYSFSHTAAGKLPGTIPLNGGWSGVALHVEDARSYFSVAKGARHEAKVSLADSYVPSGASGETFSGTLSNPDQTWKIIRFKSPSRKYLPGYKIPFVLEAAGLEIQTYVTGASKGTRVGALAGNYLAKGMVQLARTVPEIWAGRTTVSLKVVKPGERYHLVI